MAVKKKDEIVDYYSYTPYTHVIDLKSGASQKTYSINIVWDPDNNVWEAITCKCKGFINHGTCRHLKDCIEPFEKIVKRPPKVEKKPSLIPKYWYECEICNGKEFFIKPPVANADGKIVCNATTVICTKCGRSYEI